MADSYRSTMPNNDNLLASLNLENGYICVFLSEPNSSWSTGLANVTATVLRMVRVQIVGRPPLIWKQTLEIFLDWGQSDLRRIPNLSSKYNLRHFSKRIDCNDSVRSTTCGMAICRDSSLYNQRFFIMVRSPQPETKITYAPDRTRCILCAVINPESLHYLNTQIVHQNFKRSV